MRYDANARLAVGVDVGGTKIECSVVDESGTVLSTERFSTPNSVQATVEAIGATVRALASASVIRGVGVGIPGHLDAGGILRNAPNSPGIEGTRFGELVAAELNLPVRFENDANCLVLAEWLFGEARGSRCALGVILGTGVGVGAILDGVLFRGSHGWAPEPGHIPLDVHGRICRCGLRGCVEAYLSGPSILARYRDAGGRSAFRGAEDLFASDEPGAQAIVKETQYLLNRFIGALVTLFDPEVVVFGGGVSRQSELIALINPGAVGSICRSFPKIRSARGGSESGKIGAAALVFDWPTADEH